MVHRLLSFATLAVLVVAGAPAAHALSFTLDQDGCTGGCGVPLGTVSVVQGVDANTVDVTITLDMDVKFVSTGGPHHAVAWNIAGDPAITIGPLPSGFVVGPTNTGDSPFGDFNYTIDCPGCGPGASNAKPGPLSFTVSKTGGLSPSDFGPNTGGFVFAVDVIGTTGNTGNVAAFVPEPTSALLLGSGLVAGGVLLRRRRS